MTSTVSFVPLPQQAQQVTKPHPPLAIPLSEEIFYPFVTSGATRAAAPAAIGGLAALVALALLVNVAAAALSSMR
jgi:tectonic-1/3